jgi:hypothetical protein
MVVREVTNETHYQSAVMAKKTWKMAEVDIKTTGGRGK